MRDDGTFGVVDEWEHHRGWDRHQDGRRVTIGTDSDGLDAHADLTVQIPSGRRVFLFLAVGRVTVTNVSGDLLIDASSSPVTATGFTGSLGIDVGSGTVQVTRIDGPDRRRAGVDRDRNRIGRGETPQELGLTPSASA